MKLLLVGIVLIALASNATAFNINGESIYMTQQTNTGSGASMTSDTSQIHFYDTGGSVTQDDIDAFNPELTPISAKINPVDISYLNLGSVGTFGVDTSFSSTQGDNTKQAYTSDKLINQGQIGWANIGSYKNNSDVQSYQQGEFYGNATAESGAMQISSESTPITSAFVRAGSIGMDYSNDYYFLETFQGARATTTDAFNGAVAAQNASAVTNGVGFVGATSQDTQGNSSTYAQVNGHGVNDAYLGEQFDDNGDYWDAPIYQKAGAGTLSLGSGDSNHDLGLPISGNSTLTDSPIVSDYYNSGNDIGDSRVYTYLPTNGTMAEGFYETATVYNPYLWPGSVDEGAPLLWGNATVSASVYDNNYVGDDGSIGKGYTTSLGSAGTPDDANIAAITYGTQFSMPFSDNTWYTASAYVYPRSGTYWGRCLDCNA